MSRNAFLEFSSGSSEFNFALFLKSGSLLKSIIFLKKISPCLFASEFIVLCLRSVERNRFSVLFIMRQHVGTHCDVLINIQTTTVLINYISPGQIRFQKKKKKKSLFNSAWGL